MAVDNVATHEEFECLKHAVQFTPRSFTDGLANMVSGVQDRWHSRLFFLRPVLRLSIAFVWMLTGVISLINQSASYQLLLDAGIHTHLKSYLWIAASELDFLLGFLVLCNFRLKLIGSIQIILIFIFTAIISIQLPQYWLHLFGPILKNIPLVVATLVMMALESDR